MGTFKKLRVLVVDDDKKDFQVHEKYAQEFGFGELLEFNETPVETAEAFIEKQLQEPYDLIFLDLKLEGITTGEEALKELAIESKFTKKTAIIVCSAFLDEAKRLRAIVEASNNPAISIQLLQKLIISADWKEAVQKAIEFLLGTAPLRIKYTALVDKIPMLIEEDINLFDLVYAQSLDKRSCTIQLSTDSKPRMLDQSFRDLKQDIERILPPYLTFWIASKFILNKHYAHRRIGVRAIILEWSDKYGNDCTYRQEITKHHWYDGRGKKWWEA